MNLQHLSTAGPDTDEFPHLQPMRRIPPLHTSTPPPPPSPAASLRALLYTPLRVDLVDGRMLSGHLLAIDDSASLLLSSVRERRILPETEVGRNVGKYYPYSKEGGDAQGALGAQEGLQLLQLHERVRDRDLASVLVPIKHVVRVTVANEDIAAWARCEKVEIRDGRAVPPGQCEFRRSLGN